MPLYQLPQPQTGSGSWVLSTSPTLVTPILGAATATSLALGVGGSLTSAAAATLQLGGADAASPVVQTLRTQSVVTGTSNTAGVDWTFAGSRSTGTGAGGSLIFQTSPASTTGNTQNAGVTALTIDSTQTATFVGTVSAGGFVVTSTTVPTLGFSRSAANTIGFSSTSTLRFVMSATSFRSNTTGGAAVNTAAASSTVPSLSPSSSDGTTGIGAQAPGNISFIAGAAEIARVTTTGIQVISGKALQLGNAATTGLTAGVLAALTNATIVITDSTGQAYRIPCII